MTVVLPTPTQLRAVAEQCGLSLTDEDVASFRGLMQGSVDAYNLVAQMPDELPEVKYPRVYITTNTRDDRVHPGHARKFAARLGEQGHDHLYFEDTAGGHSNDADPVANARRWARHYVYLAQQLMD